jgi:LysR family hydrogen peroxide-inducible transcriptional activator
LFEDLFLLKEGHCFRDQVIKICSKYREDNKDGLRKITFEGSNLDTLKKMVEKNFGMTLIPFLSTYELKNTENYKRIRVFEPPVPIREISMVFQRAKLKKHIIDIFINEIKKSVPKKLLTREGTLFEVNI